ncbi:MAG: hypothetical protein LLH30_15880 [Candidatus Manganitrophus sp. SA1]|nr:hypothetical protein [Candidatus Manganitrophus morganii]
MLNQWTHKRKSGTVPLFAIFVLMLTSCTTLEADRIQYAGASRFPPSDPDAVEILREEPKQPNERLGEIIIDASVEPSPPISDVEQKLREEAGRLGADAVVIVFDSIQPSIVFVNPWWGGNMRTISERQLVGVAIKYQEEAEEAPG